LRFDSNEEFEPEEEESIESDEEHNASIFYAFFSEVFRAFL